MQVGQDHRCHEVILVSCGSIVCSQEGAKLLLFGGSRHIDVVSRVEWWLRGRVATRVSPAAGRVVHDRTISRDRQRRERMGTTSVGGVSSHSRRRTTLKRLFETKAT